MARRKTINVTGISRLEGIKFHDAWVAYICIACKEHNTVHIGNSLLNTDVAYQRSKWTCSSCGYVHSRKSDLPFENWPKSFTEAESIQAQRFWQAFFRIATEHPESYWKQCNVCGRVLPFQAFSKHTGWGPLERQMECRGCKGAINAELNPKRTKQQLFESSVRRRIADMLLEGQDEKMDLDGLFDRFDHMCFKTKQPLNIANRDSWAIDHILPSKFLYPLTKQNAALLSRDANNSKRDRWPSEFYTNTELIELARITSADLTLLSSTVPIVNPNIDVNACVGRFLKVREKSNLKKRILDLKKLLISYDLVGVLSDQNKKILGFDGT